MGALPADLARAIFSAAVDAVRGDRLVREHVRRAGDALFVQDEAYDLGLFARVWVAGAGKASVPMAAALVDLVEDRLAGGLVVTKRGHGSPVPGVEVLQSGHPIPDEASLAAGEAMRAFAARMDADDLVLFALSGGASALMEELVDGVSLADLLALNHRLLASGSPIRTVNAARRRLSRLKGGGLGRLFGDARVVVLVLSDVIGNDLGTIGSGPFLTPDPLGGRSRREDAEVRAFALRFGETLPSAVRDRLLGETTAPLPNLHASPRQHAVVGSVTLAVQAAADAARARGVEPLAFADPMEGEARRFARRAARELRYRAETADRPFCLIFGGETTVTIRGDGVGGRCQELAACLAPTVARMGATAALAAGTDGTDGPTEVAGGVVDAESCSRAAAEGVLLRPCLARNDSQRFLRACDGLVVTGPTGSNVNDLLLVVHDPAAARTIVRKQA